MSVGIPETLVLTVPEVLVGTFGGVLARVATLAATLPFFSHASLPVRVRVSLVLAISVMLVPVVGPLPPAPADAVALTIGLAREAAVGLCLGLVGRLLLDAVVIGGELISTLMGLSVAQLLDPMSGAQSAIPSRILSGLAFAIFLALDGHHEVIRVVVGSFSYIPLYGAVVGPELVGGLVRVTSDMLVTSIHLGLPLLVGLLLLQVVMAVVARAVPQLGTFVNVAFLLGAALGVYGLVVVLPLWKTVFVHWQARVLGDLWVVADALGHGGL